jgi:8-oxo-dGTP pyrophosphatase MutT (NUDIX family)
MLRNDIQRVLTAYLQRFPEDAATVADLRSLMDAGADVCSRSEFRGHVTCGAILLDGVGNALMIHHRALDKWLFPGGHLEAGDMSLAGAALRELVEETGISADLIEPLGDPTGAPIHLDCHPIPANPAKGEPAHRHFDFRFVWVGMPGQVSLQTEEVRGWRWEDIGQAPLAIRERLMLQSN